MKKRKALTYSILILAAGLISIVGCGPSRPETAPVSGHVTCGSKPVITGTIVFMPAQGRQAMGQIQPDGTYTLTTFAPGDGAMPGKHRVSIEARNVPKPPPMEGDSASNIAPTVEWLVPRKYASTETSKLTAEVKPGDNSIDFDIPSEAGGN